MNSEGATKNLSGRAIGDTHAAALEAFLEATPRLPHRGGGVNATAIARACGFDRQVLYKNSRCRDLLNARMAIEGLPPLAEGGQTKAALVGDETLGTPPGNTNGSEEAANESDESIGKDEAETSTGLDSAEEETGTNSGPTATGWPDTPPPNTHDAKRIKQLMAANERLERRLREAETRILAMDAERHALRQRIERLAYLEQVVLSGRGGA
jgi:hypothetical protein